MLKIRIRFDLKRVYISARFWAVLLLSLITFAGAYLRLVSLESFAPMVSDEGIYAQDSYVISLGYVPYRDVYVAQPPVFFAFQAIFFKVFGASVFVARLPNVLFSTATIILLAFFTFKLQTPNSTLTLRRIVFPLLSSSFYAVYPPIVYWSKIAVVDSTAGFFLLIGTLMIITWAKRSFLERRWCLGGSLLLAIACLTKYSTAWFIGPFMMLIFALALKRRGFKRTIRSVVLPSMLGFALPCAVLLGYLIASGAFENFLTITVWWQMNLAPRIMENKLVALTSFVSEFFLFSALFALGSYWLLWKIRERAEKGVLVIASFIALLIFFIYRDPQVHLLLGLIPVASFIAWDGLRTLFSDFQNLTSRARGRARNAGAIFGAGFVAVFFVGLILLTFLFTPYFHINAEIGRIWDWPRAVTFESQLQVAELIGNITLPRDQIFTTTAEYAFLAGRMILVPDAVAIKNQGFYIDMIGLSHNHSFEGPPPEIILPEYYLTAFEQVKPKAILKTNGIYASPDDYLWSGYFINDTWHPGFFMYVMQNYVLLDTVKSDDIVVEVYRLAEEAEKPVSFTFETLRDFQMIDLDYRDEGCQAELFQSSLAYGSEYSVNMSYHFTDTSLQPPIYARMELSFSSPLNLTDVQLLYVVVYGDNSENQLWVTFDSPKGSSGVPIGSINWQGWRAISVSPDNILYPENVDFGEITSIGVSVDYLESSQGYLALDSMFLINGSRTRESD